MVKMCSISRLVLQCVKFYLVTYQNMLQLMCFLLSCTKINFIKAIF